MDGLIGQTGDILGHNMYAYCGNHPVMRVDPSGYLWKEIWDNVGDLFSGTFGINARTEDSVLTGYYLVGETSSSYWSSYNFSEFMGYLSQIEKYK